MYWSTDPLFQTPLFGAVMPRNRFLLLLKFFHMNNNNNAPSRNDPHRDRLFKIRPFLDELFEKFQTVYTPGPSLAVDESLLLWKGRVVFRQYLPLKRARFGIKLFCLCEDSGYMYRFRVYTGKQDPTTAIDIALPHECTALSSSEKIVVYLMLHYLEKEEPSGWTTGILAVASTITCTIGRQWRVVQYAQIEEFHPRSKTHSWRLGKSVHFSS